MTAGLRPLKKADAPSVRPMFTAVPTCIPRMPRIMLPRIVSSACSFKSWSLLCVPVLGVHCLLPAGSEVEA